MTSLSVIDLVFISPRLGQKHIEWEINQCQGPALTGSRGNESRGVRLANCLTYAHTAPDSFYLLSPYEKL
jgi:hypothetical protein